jgi:hypothetical protein
MARVRRLTMAGLNGDYRLRFRDVANQDIKFESICGGTITVSRSANGTTYFVRSDTQHWRVFCTIVTPDDLPNLFYWDDCTNYGWWILEGFAQTDFGPGGFPVSLVREPKLSVDDFASADLDVPKEAERW